MLNKKSVDDINVKGQRVLVDVYKRQVLLVLYRTGADGDIGKEVLYIGKIFRVQHLIGSGHAGFLDLSLIHIWATRLDRAVRTPSSS